MCARTPAHTYWRTDPGPRLRLGEGRAEYRRLAGREQISFFGTIEKPWGSAAHHADMTLMLFCGGGPKGIRSYPPNW
jgi:hypothetical protein